MGGKAWAKSCVKIGDGFDFSKFYLRCIEFLNFQMRTTVERWVERCRQDPAGFNKRSVYGLCGAPSLAGGVWLL